MPLPAGAKLGPYEILAPIGAGGMGEVYRTRDPRLGRDVAIKVSAARFPERFELEARAIAALNHPNICQIYAIGPDYIWSGSRQRPCRSRQRTLLVSYVQHLPFFAPYRADPRFHSLLQRMNLA